MRCNNCSAELHVGILVCSVCGTPVSIDQRGVDYNNPVASDFLAPTPQVQEEAQKEQKPTIRIIKEKKSYKLPTQLEGNNRIKATLINFATFVVIIGAVIVIFIILYNTLFK